MKKLSLVTARLVFVGFHLLSAIYCLMAYLPFTYYQIRNGHLLPWLDTFARMNGLLSLAIGAVLLPLLVEPWRRGGVARWLAMGLGTFQLALAIAGFIHPILAGLENNRTSLGWGLLALGPVAGLTAVDIATYAGSVKWIKKPAGRGVSILAPCACGIFVSLLYALILALRGPAGMALSERVTALGWSVVLHLLLFLGIYLTLECLAGLAGLFRSPAQAEFWLCQLLLAIGIWMLLQTAVWPAVGLHGWPEGAASAVLSVILALLNAGVALWVSAGREVSDGIAAALSPVTLNPAPSGRSAAAAVTGVILIGGTLAVRSAALDWNYLLQKLTAAAVWLASFGCFYLVTARRARPRSVAWLAAPLALLVAYTGLEAAAPESGPLLNRWAGHDASFLLAREVLRPSRQADRSFFEFLNQNTNVPASVGVNPVSIELAPIAGPSREELPNIFIFTIDSLRRDYLSAYNPAVEFTPSIGSFGRESTIFDNAFTRYGGTGLSEPSIWSGAMLLHKQYVTPFAPMNSLEKLIAAEQYQAFLSRDTILQTILTPSPAAVELDPPETGMKLDFAETLARLEDCIDHRTSPGRPMFVYTQPQNLHISVIQREGASAPAGERYPGFYAPYAWRVKRIDEAFGKFIGFLKSRGLYERSIIILTSDHGDSLGEEGRWGHAYTLFPEIVRIPLIIHLPEALQAKVAADPSGLAFSTDITPSLYYLLGHRPIQRNGLFGMPLFTETAAERQRDPKAVYLLASSYGAVYGILSNSGRRFYVADGVNYRNYRFELTRSGDSALVVDSSIEQEQDALIRERILAINRFYGFEAKGGQL